jgi:hypothetical protein
MHSIIPIHWNIKSAPASPGRSRVGPALYIRIKPLGLYPTFPLYQCCQEAEIPAKKFIRGRGKKNWSEEFVAEFTKTGRKRGLRKFSTEVPYFTKMTNIHR